ncbi:DNA primase [Streptomyces sp. NBC_00654]|uniref:DNA primase n=1 Tax=Streptomyces sp. NBC_00654 TaxID=2975799 RepID=UPI00225B8C69|nr:DNA primase [Streptomyces sp. NBC_00654]MCX4971169.1 DNA primase [Streptomyces sp. NBC_00654]
MTTRRTCEHCDEPMPITARSHARFCKPACRAAAHRAARSIPAELTSRPRWVRRTSRKVPVSVDGGAASSTDPASWSTYRDAARSTAGAGLGFVLDGDGVVCLDLDHCLDDEGAVAGWARNVLDAADGTWVEVSQGGDGLHIWGYGALPHGRRITVGGGSVELYGTGRYIAVTGRTFGGTPQRLGDLQHVIDSLL